MLMGEKGMAEETKLLNRSQIVVLFKIRLGDASLGNSFAYKFNRLIYQLMICSGIKKVDQE